MTPGGGQHVEPLWLPRHEAMTWHAIYGIGDKGTDVMDVSKVGKVLQILVYYCDVLKGPRISVLHVRVK